MFLTRSFPVCFFSRAQLAESQSTCEVLKHPVTVIVPPSASSAVPNDSAHEKSKPPASHKLLPVFSLRPSSKPLQPRVDDEAASVVAPQAKSVTHRPPSPSHLHSRQPLLHPQTLVQASKEPLADRRAHSPARKPLPPVPVTALLLMPAAPQMHQPIIPVAMPPVRANATVGLRNQPAAISSSHVPSMQSPIDLTHSSPAHPQLPQSSNTSRAMPTSNKPIVRAPVRANLMPNRPITAAASSHVKSLPPVRDQHRQTLLRPPAGDLAH